MLARPLLARPLLARPLLAVVALSMLSGVAACRKPRGPVVNEANSTINAAPISQKAPSAPEEPAAIRVSQAWIAPGPANAAIYLTIDNDGGSDRLTGIDAPGTGPVTLHESKMTGGVMQMRALPAGIPVAAHGQVRLAPMGLHAMIDPPAHRLRPGEMVSMTLHFARQGDVEATASVHKLGEAM